MLKKLIIKISILFGFLVVSVVQSNANLDLTTGGEGWLNGGFFSVENINPAGTGLIEPIVRLQTADSLERGTNTLQKPALDEKKSWISVPELTLDYIFYINGLPYLNFVLDVNEPASKEALDLTDLILYADPADDKYPFPTTGKSLHEDIVDAMVPAATTVWDMDVGPDGDSKVLTDYNLIGGGSGWWGDLSVLIPIKLDNVGDYLYLYSEFENSNNNPEEWSLVAAPAVPVPAPLLLLGSGLIGLIGVRFRRKNLIS